MCRCMAGNPVCPVQTAEERCAEMRFKQALSVGDARFRQAQGSGGSSFWVGSLGGVLGRVFRLHLAWPREQEEVTGGQRATPTLEQFLLGNNLKYF